MDHLCLSEIQDINDLATLFRNVAVNLEGLRISYHSRYARGYLNDRKYLRESILEFNEKCSEVKCLSPKLYQELLDVFGPVVTSTLQTALHCEAMTVGCKMARGWPTIRERLLEVDGDIYDLTSQKHFLDWKMEELEGIRVGLLKELETKEEN